MTRHLISTSDVLRWADCPGSLVLSQDSHQTSSLVTDEAIAAHYLAGRCISDGSEPYEFIGEMIPVAGNGGNVITNEIEFTLDLAGAVSTYVAYVRGINGTRLAKTRISYAPLLGAPGHFGSSVCDSCIVDGKILHVIAAKLGRGSVEPCKNKQMILYAAGMLEVLESVVEAINEIHLHVMQPRVSDTSVPFVMTRAALQAEVDTLRDRAQLAMDAAISFTNLNDTAWVRKYLNPGEYQCQWCPASGVCPALRAEIAEFTCATDEEFDNFNLFEPLISHTESSVMLMHARLAFPSLERPEQFQGRGEPRFSAVLLIEPGSASHVKCKAAMRVAAAEKWGEAKADAAVKDLTAAGKVAMWDGDIKADKYDGFEGMIAISAHSQATAPPVLLDGQKNQLPRNTATIYPGCYVKASIAFLAQDNQLGKRINAQLRGVQFAKDGD